MGCDIHFVVEKKIDNRWIGVLTTEYGVERLKVKDRNYYLFAELASVRGKSSRDRTPLGLPHDVSPLALALVKGIDSDGHSHSWTTLQDFIDLYEESNLKYYKNFEKSSCPGYSYFGIEEYDSNGETKNLDDYRIVFWFDN